MLEEEFFTQFAIPGFYVAIEDLLKRFRVLYPVG